MDNSKDKNIYEYCYSLCTDEQKKQIDLAKYSSKLQKIFSEFFGEKLFESTVKKDHYILKLWNIFTIGEKRKLGRLISGRTDLKKYVHRITYNNNADKSGQLFKICKDTDHATIK